MRGTRPLAAPFQLSVADSPSNETIDVLRRTLTL
jgi:hypothetical protein